jgi:hypothetical protein
MNNSHDSHPRIAQAARRDKNGLILFLQVVPGASRAGIVGLIEDRIKVSVTKKALDGAANEAVRLLLAECFDLSKSSVTLLKGEKSKQKTVLLTGDPEKLNAKLYELIAKNS